jgi:hypothetical protein
MKVKLVTENYYLKLPIFIALKSYGRNFSSGNLRMEFKAWLIEQRKNKSKEEIVFHNLDVYDKNGSYTIDEVITVNLESQFVIEANKRFYLSDEIKDVVYHYFIKDGGYDDWLKSYTNACRKVPNKNIDDDEYFLKVHFYRGTNPNSLGSLSVGSIAQECEEKISNHIINQHSKIEGAYFIIEPEMLLDYNFVGIPLDKVELNVIIPQLSYIKIFKKFITPFPNKRIIQALVDEDNYFEAVSINPNIKNLDVICNWKILDGSVKHTFNVDLKEAPGYCYFNSFDSFITYNLSDNYEKDLEIQRPTAKLDILDDKNVEITERVSVSRKFPNSPEYCNMYINSQYRR